jgi:hypothetical protein
MSALTMAHRPPTHLQLFLNLICLSVRMNSRSAAAFYRMGLGCVEAFILLYVYHIAPQDCTMRHLRRTLQLNNASLAKAVNGLVRKGCLFRQEITPGRTAKWALLRDSIETSRMSYPTKRWHEETLPFASWCSDDCSL